MLDYAIHLEHQIEAHPGDVWRALTESSLLEKWLMNGDFVPVEGHSFTFRADPTPRWDGIVQGKVMEVVSECKLAYSWRGTADMPETIVTWHLQRMGSGTLLKLDHIGFRGLKYWLVGRMLKRGWRRMIVQDLPKAVMTLRRAD